MILRVDKIPNLAVHAAEILSEEGTAMAASDLLSLNLGEMDFLCGCFRPL